MDEQKKYSREMIERYRAQDFTRQVIKREPFDLTVDEVTLSCGHKTQILARLLNTHTAGRMGIDCKRCAEEWLAKAFEDEKRG